MTARRQGSPRAAHALAASTLTSLAACGSAPAATPSTTPTRSLLAETIVGTQRCGDEGDPRPFVVEWDATDLTTFEAQARRDVILVRYEGCTLTPLYGCKDGGLAGRLGAYAPPQWTSGGLEALEIENLDDLYTRLPLGVASFAGRVQRGESLKLSYFVSGMVTSTRDILFEEDARRVSPECARATHFVRSYNLGAFSLAQAESHAAEARAGALGVETGGGTSARKKSLRRGGDLSSCETESQRDCRVPIRVTLRKLDPGAPPGGAPAPQAAGRPAAAADADAERLSTDGPASMQAWDLRREATEKMRQGDGKACLALLDRADRMDPDASRKVERIEQRSLCLMKAGQCAEGKRLYRDALVGANTDHSASDQWIDQQVAKRVDASCPIADRSPQAQLQVRIGELRTQDPDACARGAAEVAKLLPHVAPFEKFGPGRRDGAHAIALAARCLAKANRCAEAKKWHAVAAKHDDKGTVGTFSAYRESCAP